MNLTIPESWSKITERFGGWNQHPSDLELKREPSYRFTRPPRRGCELTTGAAGAMTRQEYSLPATPPPRLVSLKNCRCNPVYKPCTIRALSYPLTTRPTVAQQRKLVCKGLWEAEVPGIIPWERGGLRRKQMFHVYVIKDIQGVCKVGLAKDVQKRLKTLQTGHPLGFWLVRTFSFESRMKAHYIEKSIHKMYRSHALKGEWFGKRMLPLFLEQLDKFGSVESLVQQYEVPGMTITEIRRKKPKRKYGAPVIPSDGASS